MTWTTLCTEPSCIPRIYSYSTGKSKVLLPEIFYSVTFPAHVTPTGLNVGLEGIIVHLIALGIIILPLVDAPKVTHVGV